jgi:membrane associated rhomboid family serine protease
MPACVSCGREIPPAPVGELNICPECRTAILARAPSQNSLPTRSRSRVLENMPVTSVLVGINALVFVLMTLSGVSFTNPELQKLVQWGADWGPYTLTTQPWRVLTSNYVHIGIIHIALNMWCLWNLGALAERIFDRWTYVLIYTACGIGGSILGVWWRPMLVAAGASGAIFGIAGALISALYLGRLPVHPSAIKSTLKSLLLFAGYNLFFGMLPGISNAAHLGGLITGLGLGAALAPHLTAPPDERNSWRRLVFIMAGVLLLVFFYFVRRSALPSLLGAEGGVNSPIPLPHFLLP